MTPRFVRSRGREYILKSLVNRLFNMLDEDHLRVRVQTGPQILSPPRNNKSGIRMIPYTAQFMRKHNNTKPSPFTLLHRSPAMLLQ